ncbi:hypothetical protein G7Y89_g617 [Cudoniella acicularis]|uniref:Zn(2)-C6 fungal-type domain-containing protein n=1 Tax=Cudoniella acicularis TaxID=354080 RepID=A0A8H4RWU8_9HELO|nr:hypothetical protein G7Y89_g617 [Cudoniella acicularis]
MRPFYPSESQFLLAQEEQAAEARRQQEFAYSPYYAPHAAPTVAIVQRDSRLEHHHFEGGLGYPASHAHTAASPIKTESSVCHDGFGTYATAMPGKRTAAGEPSGAPGKQPRAERPEEFSSVVKKKLQSSTRTGQACDRCKVRKIRCDGLPGGCSPCLQNNTECRTTDRITGRATSRGYVEGIEQQNRDLQQQVRELRQKLLQAGIDVKPANGYQDATSPGFEYNQSSSQAPAWSPTPSSYTPETANSIVGQQQETNMFRTLPAFRAGCTGDNYLGVSAANSNLSSIKGTVLSILGMEIDIADFESIDMDEPDPSLGHLQLYNKSYQAFLQTTLNRNPEQKPDLPPKDQAFTYMDWYFRVINPYVPLLHKPTLLAMLSRFYEPHYKPKASEIVLVHTVMAIMTFQVAVRNWEDPGQQATYNRQSNMHYHYALSKFYELSCSHTVQDVQALALICLHLRNFPKPGASWILTQATLSRAIELGLHRSFKRWATDITPNPLDVEMRKRIFWSLILTHVALSGKLGRPLAFRYEDFDVEMPEEIDDDLLSENGIDNTRPAKCLHKIGIQAIKMIPLFMEMYNTIYSVRRQPEKYIPTVNALESKLRSWKENFPPELTREHAKNDQHSEHQIFALYAEAWTLEFRILLRHPSVSMTNDTQFNADSMRICVESSRQMLRVVKELQKFKSLDTTWYNSAVYVMAITTTLFAQWEKRGETSPADFQALEEEMKSWLAIMGDVGRLLGTRLREAVQVVTEGTLGLLKRSLPVKNIQKHEKIIKLSESPPEPSPPIFSTNSSYGYSNSGPANGNDPTGRAYAPVDGQLHHQPTPYPQATQYQSYSDTVPNSSSIAYTPQQTPFSNYPTSTGTADAPLLAALAAQGSQMSPDTWRRDSHNPTSGSQAWQQWTAMAGNLEPQDCYSANALMDLQQARGVAHGNGVPIPQGITANSGDAMDHLAGEQVNGIGVWPQNIFGMGHGGPGS